MRKTLIALFLSGIFAIPACYAQIDIQSDDGNSIHIGPGGISVDKKGGAGKSVRIGPGGIQVDKGYVDGNKQVRIGPGGININNGAGSRVTTGRSTTTIKKGSTGAKKTVAKTSTVAVLSLADQVGMIEVSVSGKKSPDMPLIARVEKLEMENLGQKGTGTLKVRVEKLASSLGVNIAGTPVTASSASVSRRTTVTGPGTTVTTDDTSTRITTNGTNVIDVTTGGGFGTDRILVQGNEIVVDGDNQNVSYVCKNSAVVINSSNCKVKLTGACSGLVLNGSNNSITCDKLSGVVVNGSRNNVRWSGNMRPSIVDNGSGNVLRPM